MFKPTLIAALLLVPALGFAADNTAAPKGERGSYFKKADTDANGTLSRAEVEKSVPRLAMTFDQIDANKDGQLSPDELRTARRSGHHGHHGRLDVNNDGSISRDEAKTAPRLAQNFDAMDANKDGVLTRDEMHAWRKAQPRPTPNAPVEPVKP